MRMQEKTKAELLQELDTLRQRTAELEQANVARAAADSALRESEEIYRNTLDSGLVGMYIIQDLVFKTVNCTMASLFGYQVSELENKMSPADLVVAEQRAAIRENLTNRAAGVPGKPYEIRCQRKDGSEFDAVVWGKAVSFNGRPASVGTLVDISELKQAHTTLLEHRAQLQQQVAEQTLKLQQANQALQQDIDARVQVEQALRLSEERLRGLINATDEDAVLLCDNRLRFQVANARAARGFGLSVEQLTGKSLYDLVPAELAAEREAKLQQVLDTGEPTRFEDERVGRWYDNNVCPVFGTDNTPQAVAVFARDITGRKEMERQIAQAKEDAERANQAKSRFLAAANHDLRQPLQALSLLLNAFSLTRLEPKAEQILSDMQNSLSIMETLLNSLLDISKLEAGVFKPDIRDFRLLPFLHHERSHFKVLAADKGIRIRVFPADAVLRTDPVLLARIVQNFVSNAIRHTAGGKILIGCRRAGSRRRIEVWDQGEGIPEDQTENIFEEFFQLGNPARNRHQGLGLGLSIAKRLAELLDLRLNVRSVPGHGSVFSVEVPLGTEVETIPEPGRQRVVGRPQTDGSRTILIVEDDEAVLDATACLLQLWGFRTLCAASADEALRLVRQAGDELFFAVLDYQLPDLWNGVELHSQLEQILGCKLRAVLITGDTSVKKLQAVESSGLGVMHKPVDTSELYRLIIEGN